MYSLFYTPRHEWIRLESGEAAVGLTGISLKGDVVYIELPDIGRHMEKDEICASVETVKAVSEVHAPVAGVVYAVNDAVFDDPDIISRQPMDTWLFKLRSLGDERQGLLTEREYAELKPVE